MLTALYIHIPFCDSICSYCDFHKEMAKLSKKEEYIKALLLELTMNKSHLSSIKTIYIGGGTPTSLPNDLLILFLSQLSTIVDVSSLEEFTIEGNPNDFDIDKVNILHQFGISRVSLGVQTFNKEQLTNLHRTHDKEDVMTAITNLRNVGITNINIDLIFSLPNQTIKEVETDVAELLKLDVPHISYYSLILEEKTLLYHLYEKGELRLNSEELEVDMYQLIIKKLKENGYNHYEISNFSKKGFESKHNSIYWMNQDYLGVGSGSHSLLDNKRFYNIRNVKKYIESVTNGNIPSIKEERNALQEEMIMGLRLLKGIKVAEVESKYKINLLHTYPLIKDFIEKGLLKQQNGYISLTNKGLMVGNIVFSIF